tara:strand:- start:1224 stop:2066 length:843 start_codon:yes stop_codon:yes gene_type:complete
MFLSILKYFIKITISFEKGYKFVINIKMQMPKLKVKVYFYHLFMLAIVMLLCFYLVYRDMKRVESNVLGIYKRVGILEKFNNNFGPKMNELLDRSRALAESELQVEHEYVKNNVESDTYVEVDNMMKNVINIHENVLENEGRYEDVGEVDEVCKNDLDNTLDDKVCEVDNRDDNDNTLDNNKIYEIDNSISSDDSVSSQKNEDNKDNDGKDNDGKDGEVDGVMDLLNIIENKDNLRDLSELNEEELLDKTNNELKEYLKSKNLSNTGNKKKLVETILNLN